jgi:hypothetical protein
LKPKEDLMNVTAKIRLAHEAHKVRTSGGVRDFTAGEEVAIAAVYPPEAPSYRWKFWTSLEINDIFIFDADEVAALIFVGDNVANRAALVALTGAPFKVEREAGPP